MVTESEMVPFEALRVQILINEAQRYDHRPLYEYLVLLAQREGMAGVIVFRGIEGFGAHRHVHTHRLVEVSDDLPVVVELVDRRPAVQRFLTLLNGVVDHGTVTLSPVTMRRYRSRPPA